MTQPQHPNLIAMEAQERLEHAAKKAAKKAGGTFQPLTNGTPGPSQDTLSQDTLVARRASDIEPKAVEWIWLGRIARGKHTAIAGEPGTNKSTLTCEMAARITTRGEWACDEGGPPRKGRVLILSAEDDAEDTIVPRLIAAGADRDMVDIIDGVKDEKGQRSFNLTADIDRLEQRIKKHGDVDLVIIDPISAYMGKTDSHKNSEVRGVLEPLQKMAERTGVAVVSVTHFNKPAGGNSAGKALHRFMGSIAFTAAARMVFAVIADPDNPARRLFLHVKNNLAPPLQGLAFTVVEKIVEVTGGSTVHLRIAWETEPVKMTADEAMTADGGKGTALDDAVQFLRDLLADGPVPKKIVEAEAEEAGLSLATVRRAKDRLGVEAIRSTEPGKFGTGRGEWLWSLKMLTDTQGAQINSVSTLSEDERLEGAEDEKDVAIPNQDDPDEPPFGGL